MKFETITLNKLNEIYTMYVISIHRAWNCDFVHTKQITVSNFAFIKIATNNI